MHIEELIEEIVETVESGFNLKLFHRRIVEGDKILDRIEELRTSLPSEFESAKRITQDRNKIIASAENWASNKMAGAEKEAESIVATANTKAANIVSNAEAQAQQIVESAKLHAEQLVSENNITKVANERAAELMANTKSDCEVLMNTTRNDCDALTSQAKQWSDEVRQAAYEYAMNMVSEVERFLSGSTSDLNETKSKLENLQ